MEQLMDNASYMENFEPLTAEELAVIDKVVSIINDSIAIPCTGCSYCINNCPMNIAIPKYFSLYNADVKELESKAWTAQTLLYGHLAEQFGKVSACVGCGACYILRILSSFLFVLS